MKKAGIVIGGVIVLLVVYLVFFKTPAAPPMGTDTPVSGDNSQLPAAEVEPSAGDIEVSMPNPDTTPTGNRQMAYQLYKHQQEIAYGELDRIEQMAVNFIAEFFTAPEGETEEELAERLKEYFHPEVSPMDGLWPMLNDDRFPHEGKRDLQAVYLLPEYLEEEYAYSVPMQVRYNHNEQEKEEVIHLAISKMTQLVNGKIILIDEPGLEMIMGHYPRQDFVNEIVRKYNLDGRQ